MVMMADDEDEDIAKKKKKKKAEEDENKKESCWICQDELPDVGRGILPCVSIIHTTAVLFSKHETAKRADGLGSWLSLSYTLTLVLREANACTDDVP